MARAKVDESTASHTAGMIQAALPLSKLSYRLSLEFVVSLLADPTEHVFFLWKLFEHLVAEQKELREPICAKFR